MSITLENIKSEQNKLAEMIAKFETQATPAYIFPETEIELKHNEHYAGIILGKDGEPSHHLILIDGNAESLNWEGAKKWANELGGELPTRREQSLLFANLKDQFESAWYWSSEQHASDSGFAWLQSFLGGSQHYYLKSAELRARAVRRLVIL